MRKLLALALVVSSFAVLVGGANAKHSWGKYHWERTSNPFTLELGNNVGEAWTGYLATTSLAWSESAVLDAPVGKGNTSGSTCAATTGRVEVCSAAYGNNGWLGLAQIWLSGSHITKGTVKVNDTYFSTAQYDNPNERNHVMCQEVGHTFGLGHTSENGSSQDTCMDYSSSPSSTGPNPHDFEQLSSIYAHLDGGGGGGTPPSCKNPRKCPGPPANLPPFAQASAARGHVYVDDLGHGNRRVTFVRWVSDARGKG